MSTDVKEGQILPKFQQWLQMKINTYSITCNQNHQKWDGKVFSTCLKKCNFQKLITLISYFPSFIYSELNNLITENDTLIIELE